MSGLLIVRPCRCLPRTPHLDSRSGSEPKIYDVEPQGWCCNGGAYGAINEAELLLLLGTDFPFSEFLPGEGVKKVQIDKKPNI
jgi:thiamine pyrophosphate-dependent acetolactate synthase large subunit-like protein